MPCQRKGELRICLVEFRFYGPVDHRKPLKNYEQETKMIRKVDFRSSWFKLEDGLERVKNSIRGNHIKTLALFQVGDGECLNFYRDS